MDIAKVYPCFGWSRSARGDLGISPGVDFIESLSSVVCHRGLESSLLRGDRLEAYSILVQKGIQLEI